MSLSINRLVVALLCIGIFGPAHPAGAQDPASLEVEVGCRACVLVDDKGAVLFSRQAGRPFPNASTTKMVTALLAAEHTDGDEKIKVSPVAESVPGGKLSLMAGESWSADELLKALLMNSSNDAAVVLAEHIAGTERAFVEMMNSYVAELGADDTFFVTSHGLDEPGHRSSALDLVLIAEELLAEPGLAAIVRTQSTVIESSTRRAMLENTNLLLEGYRGAIGVKTGYTALAGNVLVAAAERHGRRLIAVAMGSDDPFADSAALLDAGFERLRNTILLRTTSVLDTLVFASSGSTAVVAGREVRGIDDPDEVTIRFEPSGITSPISAGDAVGHIHVSAGGRLIRTVPAVARDHIAAPEEQSWGRRIVTAILRTAAYVVPGEDEPL